MLSNPGLIRAFALAVTLTSVLAASEVISDSERESRALGLFNIIRFGNDACAAASDSDVEGRCYKEDECEGLGGKVDGNCAAGQYGFLGGVVEGVEGRLAI